MVVEYQPDLISDFFDAYGEREWSRFDVAPGGAANLAIHRAFLVDFMEPGWRVLEIGAGPGRFTIELASLGARVVTTDISLEQLRLNETRVAEAGLEDQVEARVQVDVVDLGQFDDDSFDAVVCFGGPLSYVLEQADRAVREMVRVTRPGGTILASVMSLLGTVRAYRPGVVALVHERGVQVALDEVLETGVLTASINDGHQLKMYRWAELVELLERNGCSVLDGAASNYITIGHEPTDDKLLEQALLDWELRLCRDPGIRDAGTHLLAAARLDATRHAHPR